MHIIISLPAHLPVYIIYIIYMYIYILFILFIESFIKLLSNTLLKGATLHVKHPRPVGTPYSVHLIQKGHVGGYVCTGTKRE